MEIVFRPLPGWPKAFTNPRQKGDFAPTFEKSLALLKRELSKLEAKGVVVQTAHREQDFSVTIGRPLAGTQPQHPGIIVIADTKHGTLNWTCDLYRSWIHNMRNIALYMERQRLLAGQGIGEGTEAYRGHKMLPGPITSNVAGMTVEDAARFVAGLTAGEFAPEAIVNGKGTWTAAYRAAVKKCHADKTDERSETWLKLQDAKVLLDGLHQGRK